VSAELSGKEEEEWEKFKTKAVRRWRSVLTTRTLD